MKIGFLSDCHGNLAGLQAAYDALKKAGADNICCLGDVVGYGAQARECIDFVRSMTQLTIAGNHDHALVGKMSVQGYHEQVADTIERARHGMAEEHMSWLYGLPMEHVFEFQDHYVFLSHAHPSDYLGWCYYPVHDYWNHPIAEQTHKTVVCFYGHTHRPTLQHMSAGSPRQALLADQVITLPQSIGETWVINVGSCGQPRDGDPRVSSVLYDATTRTIQVFRTPYDVEGTQALFRQRGVPHFLIQRIGYGM